MVKDMQEAMVKIKAQLGSDAIILSNRPVRKKGVAGWFSKPLIEVMVAYEPGPKNGSARQEKAEEAARVLQAAQALQAVQDWQEAEAATPTPPQAQPPQAQQQPQPQLQPPQPPQPDKLDEMEKRLESLNAAMLEIAGKLHNNSAPQRYCKEIQQQYVNLIDNEVEEGVARSLADEAQDISDRRKADPAEAFEQAVRYRLGEAEGIRMQRFKRTVAVFIGPTGAGKTTTIAKLAARYAIHEKAKVGLVTADAYRIAAHEQIKTYSDILEVPLKTIYKPEEIKEALEELEDADIVFVDTPGKSPNDKAHISEIASIIEHSGASEIFLVISATTGYKSCAMAVDQYGFVKDFKVLLTKLDETPTAGMYLNARAITGKPLSYVTTGQSVPDDIELFDAAAASGQLVWKA
jgi:flagellar biosynthesis protein FlhF